ncbi:MAG: PBP1A family penicillin-binding protein [Limnochordales bacterium]|nr:PBP1A family penicillin-binding protein [Limnochordales bacterium]
MPQPRSPRQPSGRHLRASSRLSYGLRVAFLVILALTGLLTFFGVGLFVSVWYTAAPSLDEVVFNPELTTIIYDRNGREVHRLYRENRIWLPISEIPATIQDAIVAIEDAHFWEHRGINPIAIIRALLVDLRDRRAWQGGSTITQQLAKNAFLTHERTLQRKLKEAVWAIQIERKYTKEEILERYLNEIAFGPGIYGVEAASQHYFGHSARTLTLAEAALLAAIPRGPALYDPYRHPDAALARRNLVLRRMAEEGFISEAQARAAQAEPLTLATPRQREANAAAFVDYVITQLLNEGFTETDIWAGGLQIYTTLDLSMQAAAEQALWNSLPDGFTDSRGLKQPQGALVTIDVHSGAILAMVGGRKEPQNKFNRAVYAVRQPGSAMKPFVYAVALQHNFTPASIIVDEPVSYPMGDGTTWEPKNYDDRFRGPMLLRDALEQSVNTVAVKLLEEVGVGNVLQLARRLGLSYLVDRGEPNDLTLSLALGGLTRGVTPLEMAAAYAAFANGGTYYEPYAVVEVRDARGDVVYRANPRPRVVLEPATAYVLTDMLKGVILRGTGKRADIGRPAAGKTGTTSDNTNAWFVGYTPRLSTAVWVGNDRQSDQLVFNGVTYGSALAAEIWGRYMRQATAGMPAEDFPRPPGIVEGVPIDVRNGQLATSNTPTQFIRYEVFILGTEPAGYVKPADPPAATGDATWENKEYSNQGSTNWWAAPESNQAPGSDGGFSAGPSADTAEDARTLFPFENRD